VIYAYGSELIYLIPVLLHTSFCSARERLRAKPQSMVCTFSCICLSMHTRMFHTFAISAQLLPASLIFLSLCSSAAVHGVLVRLFFTGGCIEANDVSCSGIPDDAAILDDGPAAGAIGLDNVGPETRRFWRGLEGCKVSCLGEISDAVESAG
jgi:hypothetical protein